LPSEADAGGDLLVGSMIRFRYFSHFLITLDTKQNASQIMTSPIKHKISAVNQNNCLQINLLLPAQGEDFANETPAQQESEKN
jgi:hypothetical protein